MIGHILSAFEPPDDLLFATPDYRSLRGFCHISRMWLGPARKQLYNFIRLTGDRRTPYLLRTMIQSPTLGALVQTLIVLESSEELLDNLYLLPNVTTVHFQPLKAHHPLKLTQLHRISRFLFDGDHGWDPE